MPVDGKFEFHLVGGERVEFGLQRVREASADLRTVWHRFARIMANHNMHQFASEGAWAGAPWPPLNPTYEARKVAMGFPANPLMRTMHLFRAAVTPGRLLRRAGRQSAEYVIDDRKYVFHHFGAPRAHIPARPIMVASQRLTGELERIVGDHIVEPW